MQGSIERTPTGIVTQVGRFKFNFGRVIGPDDEDLIAVDCYALGKGGISTTFNIDKDKQLTPELSLEFAHRAFKYYVREQIRDIVGVGQLTEAIFQRVVGPHDYTEKE